uniref:Uncharacterized protein n=1 Tax=Magallana gigas TaxID=29159 RepID=A0A8W8P234_MAGGI
MECDWSSGALYSGCVAPTIREIAFQFFDASSAIDLSCSNSVDRIFIAECDNVCTNLGRILRSSHVLEVFCADLKCEFPPSIPTRFSSKMTTTTIESPTQDVKEFSPSIPTRFSSKMTTTTIESPTQDVKEFPPSLPNGITTRESPTTTQDVKVHTSVITSRGTTARETTDDTPPAKTTSSSSTVTILIIISLCLLAIMICSCLYADSNRYRIAEAGKLNPSSERRRDERGQVENGGRKNGGTIDHRTARDSPYSPDTQAENLSYSS